MGHGIAQVSAMAGYTVTLRDIEQSFLDKAMEKIRWSLDKMVEKQKMTKENSDAIFSRIAPVVDLKQALKDADLLIEAVPEDMNLKKKVYAEVDAVSEEKTLYASNTSTLPITEMASLTGRPDRFVGLHFFNPPQLMPLVEVIPGNRTDESLVEVAMSFVKKVGKQPVLCKKGCCRVYRQPRLYTACSRSRVLSGQGWRFNDCNRLGCKVQDVISDGYL